MYEVWLELQLYFTANLLKNSENQLRTDRVNAMSSVLTFFWNAV